MRILTATALFITLIVWGWALLPKYTLSAESFAQTIHPICRTNPQTFECQVDPLSMGNFDPAPAWCETPLDYYYRRSGGLPKWNPYMGSGYPVVFDSHHGHFSPTRWFLRHVSGDSGRDILVFARVFFWVLGMMVALHLSGIAFGINAVIAVGAAIAPYLTASIDTVSLDIDLLFPWFWVALIGPAMWGYGIALALGVGVGLLAFQQSQSAFIVMAAVCAIAAKKPRVAGALFIGFLLTSPVWFPQLKYLSEFASSRSLVCIAGWHQIGFRQLLKDLFTWTRQDILVGTLPGFALIFWTVKKWRFRAALIPLLFGVGIMVWGAPFFCPFPFLSSVRFGRHLTPATQFLFLYGLALGFATLDGKAKKVGVAVVAFTILRFGTATPYLKNLLRWQLPVEVAPIAKINPSGTLIDSLQKTSEQEDRRHYSPWEYLYPNWGSAVGVMDVRLLSPLLPMGYYALNSQLYHKWYTHGFHLIRPDRFIGPEKMEDRYDPDLFKVLALHRVSLFTLRKDLAEFPDVGGPYSPESCQRFAEDSTIAAYRCHEMGGVGYFPKKVISISSFQEGIRVLKATPLDQIQDLVVMQSNSISPAEGKIEKMERNGDKLIYYLQVSRPGLFVIADTWFPGWEAHINGNPTPILHANLAFKAVAVPVGTVVVDLTFNP